MSQNKNYEEQFCSAIDIIVENAISKASFDKTIQATIISCVDSAIGKYKVKYQDSTFYAYASSVEVTYSKNANVYVLVPGNDMSREKTILGAVNKLGTDYIATQDDISAYQIIGDNIINNITKSFGLKSYLQGGESINIYETNQIEVDEVKMESYIPKADTLIVRAKFRTSLPKEQQYQGNYGITFNIRFMTPTGNQEIRSYTLDISNMRGNPYRLTSAVQQTAIFNIEGANFVAVDSVTIFCKDFLNYKDNPPVDIFISGIEFLCANRLKEEQRNGTYLNINTSKKGTVFHESAISSDYISLLAELKIKGIIQDPDVYNIEFYWFEENPRITSSDLEYSKYGGNGWSCINEYSELQIQDGITRTYNPGSKEKLIYYNQVLTSTKKYKCVAVYNNQVFENEVVIYNYAAQYNISLEADNTEFYNNLGTANINCLVDSKIENLDPTKLSYYWNKISASGERYTLNSDVNSLSIDAKDIYLNNTIQCTVYIEDSFLGVASIVLTNTMSDGGLHSYTLVLNNGSQVFLYDEEGISPASPEQENPIIIPELSFTIYDNKGNALSDAELAQCNIEWVVPSENTFLSISNLTPDESTDDTHIYKNQLKLNYQIANYYSYSNYNNDIRLYVTYKDAFLAAGTNLTFTKQGQVGTNGTEVFCKISLNVQDGTQIPKKPMIIYTKQEDGNYTKKLNFIPALENYWFIGELWVDNLKIFSGYESSSNYLIKWKILKNVYYNDGTTKIEDDTLLECVNNNFNIKDYSGEFFSNGLANLVQVSITDLSTNKIYYSAIPVLVSIIENSNYNIQYNLESGFDSVMYSSDGWLPQYEKGNNFKFEGDIDNCSREVIGALYDLISSEDGQWTPTNNLIINNFTQNDFNARVSDFYSGECVSNCFYIKFLSNLNETVLSFYIPIYLYLNRYGIPSLNAWDGNKIEINEEDNYILSPQVGAGIKNSQTNTFSGIVIGEVKNKGISEVGLFGYHEGIRSIFLDANTGKAVFGSSDGGRIEIDGQRAILTSGNYLEGKSGLQIDLVTPSIKFGNNSFIANSEGVSVTGYINAKTGKIGPWEIDENGISYGNTLFTKNFIKFGNTLQYDATTNDLLLNLSNFSLGGIKGGTKDKTVLKFSYSADGTPILTLDASFKIINFENGASEILFSEYFTFDTKGGMKIGNLGTSNQIGISSEKISFLKDNNEIAWITGEKMAIKHVNVDSLSFGRLDIADADLPRFYFVPLTDGSVSLLWK